MDGHDSSISSADCDLRKVAILFRQSLSTFSSSKEAETEERQVDDLIENKTIDEATTFTDVSLKDYVEAYNELNKMFPKLGLLFSFVASDVGDKTRILNEHLLSAVSEKYASIGSMLDYEKDEIKILDPSTTENHHPHRSDLANGSRTLLRLHRALLFVVEFINSIRQATGNDKMASLARKAYDDTLACHHAWLVRKGVHMAIRTLPNRQQLLTDLAGSDVATEEAERVMDEIVAAGRAVYNVVQKLYEDRCLLDLP